MPCILDIATAVPEFLVKNEDFVKFYANALSAVDAGAVSKKLAFINWKAKIDHRYSCVPDFNGLIQELFTDGDYVQTVEKRLELYREKIMPLATDAIDKVLSQANIEPGGITHIITVTCTGLFSPGFELLIAEHYGMQKTEKFAINFLGCYAAMKAIKLANYIAQSDPAACVLIVSAELCTLHFYPSVSDEDIVANLLFADGAAAMIICGNESSYIKNKIVLNIDAIGSALIPGTMDLMTWNIASSAFRMFLSKDIVKAIKENIRPVVHGFLQESGADADYWAIHPGGVRIVEAVRESLGLTESNVADSMSVLQQYGNMSSPTILFILSSIFNKIRKEEHAENKRIFSCAFGPGLSIEMIGLSSIDTTPVRKIKQTINAINYAVQA